MPNQPTPVSSGLARKIGLMAEAAAMKYRGGLAEAELAKGNDNFGDGFHALLDQLAQERRARRVPANLAELLERQVARLVDIGAAKEAKIAEGKYRDELMTGVAAFAWRKDWAAIALNRVAIVDFRLPGAFLADAGGVACYIAPDECTLFQGVVQPDGVAVIQGQWGVKYRKKSPRWCIKNFNPLEQGLTVKERLTVHLYEGEAALREVYTDLPGSVSPGGSVPYLRLWRGEPKLLDGFDGFADPRYGSGSRGK
ncbi:hypothetical protein HYZ64_01140 [Candidatus Berkelbacteria bacterium]|nr:hypothetical protein [Candidatus Berkelbacteria bacterium]